MTELAVALTRAGALIQRLEDHGLLDGRVWTISATPHCPWVHVVVTDPGNNDPRTYHHFAIWRPTGGLFAVAADGTIADAPIKIGDLDP